MFTNAPVTGNPLHDALTKKYSAAQADLLMGNYEQVEAHIKEAKSLLQQGNITTFTANTPRGLNPTAWVAVEAALLLRKGDYALAARLAEEAMFERDKILGGNIVILDNVSIRFLLLQIKLEAHDYKSANEYLKNLDEYFARSTLTDTEPYLTMFFSYLTYTAKCQFGLGNCEGAAQALDVATRFYERNKFVEKNNLSWQLPVFASFYASFQSMLDKKNVSKLNENFAQAEDALKACFGDKPHYLKVEFYALKARALRQCGLLEESGALLAKAEEMFLNAVFKDPYHPLFRTIQKESELLEIEKRFNGSAKHLSKFSLMPPVLNNNPHEAEVVLRNKNGM